MSRRLTLILAVAVCLVFGLLVLTQAADSGDIDKTPDAASLRYRLEHQNEPYSTQDKEAGAETILGADALAITANNNPNDLIDALLVPGTCITVTSVSVTGAATASGLYTDGPFSIDDGVILASGDVTNALPPDVSGSTTTDFGLPGCPECDDIIPGYISYDAVFLEITFDASDACSSITFDFVFGSEEYPEWVGTEYNDVFGAYLNGTQVAFDENGNSITINGPFFSGAYVQIPPGNGLEYDGSTLRLTTTTPIVPGSVDNTLMFVVCDAGDHRYDSGVFLAGLAGSAAAEDTCTGIAPEFDHPPTPECNDTVYVVANDLLTFDVQASDPGPNSDIVTLTASGLPAGASMSPVLPVSGNPVASTFSWTPGDSDVGNHVVTFVATDAEPCQFSDQCNFVIAVLPDEIGGVTIMRPDPMYLYWAYAIEPVPDTAYLGDLEEGQSVGDINTATLKINGVLDPLAATVVPGYPGFTGEVMCITFLPYPFALMYDDVMDTSLEAYTVSGELVGGTGVAADGEVSIIGKRSDDPTQFIVPPGEIVLRADCDRNGFVNISDVAFMIEFIFAGGEAPSPHLVADTDCSMSVTVSDVVYMIAYIFGAGPAPCLAP